MTGNNFKDKIDSPSNNYCLSDKILLLKIYTELNDQFKLSKQKKKTISNVRQLFRFLWDEDKI